MKIAFLHYHLKTGGVTTVLRQQINAIGCLLRLPARTGAHGLGGAYINSLGKLRLQAIANVVGAQPMGKTDVGHFVQPGLPHDQRHRQAQTWPGVEPLAHCQWQTGTSQRPLEHAHRVVMRYEPDVSLLAEPYPYVMNLGQKLTPCIAAGPHSNRAP